MTALRQETVGNLPDEVAVPSYDRSKLTVGIVHFGVGGFHRAHQAMYLDRLMNDGRAHDWAICGVGILPGDSRMRDALTAQDGLYTLVLKHPDGAREASVIGSIVEYLFAPDDPEAVVERMADPAVRIVSLTVTEGGYNIHPVTGEFDAENPAIRADLKPGAAPATVFGLVVEALRRRRARGVAPFTLMSCDNIQRNGDVARRTFTAFARLVDSGLAAWIEDAVAFPDSMVDRITPVTTDQDREALALRSGVEDAWPVVCEPFTQWVLQERFPTGRPPWEEAGVQVVADVEPYELMKLRLLNAGHQALCYFGYLSGYRYAHEAATDPAIAAFLLGYMDIEATPTLRPVPGIDLDDYKRTLIERFANPEVRDTLARLCAEASDRIPKWLLPVVREQLARGGEVTRAAAVVAGWARYAEGVDESGEPIELVDRLKERLTATARTQREHPTAFIENRDLFGDLADDRRFVEPYLRALESLHSAGARATVRELAGPGIRA
ncbi:mannitol dehydrogenase family protein [Streptosporangium sp. NBC_01639]|uniref:mannitol dehydrogenase family protein n=1 Tax=Streptosporangium sp. NBC_01639 TaxID=2975948 RepID=UPI003866727E|nr:mannitol dehydrogenase family protein [Streptosporangium sp. NBC_01639]